MENTIIQMVHKLGVFFTLQLYTQVALNIKIPCEMVESIQYVEVCCSAQNSVWMDAKLESQRLANLNSALLKYGFWFIPRASIRV